jgi:hypothetical protein
MGREKKPSSDLVKVYGAQQRLEAVMIKAILDDEGIPAMINDVVEDAGCAAMGYSAAYDVVVSPEQAAEARALLEAERGPDWTCPTCGEDVDGVFDSCWKCGRERDKG